MQKQYIIFGIIVLLVAVGTYYYFTQYQKEEVVPQSQEEVEPEGGLGSELFNQVDSSDPTSQIPDTNPFAEDAASVNPFGDTQTNPFKDVFQNPFGN